MAMNRDMIAKIAQMGAQLQKAQAELAEQRVEGTSGGGAVQVVITGGMKVESIKIDKEVIDPDDVEMLEDLLTAALNEVLAKVQLDAIGRRRTRRRPAAWAASPASREGEFAVGSPSECGDHDEVAELRTTLSDRGGRAPNP